MTKSSKQKEVLEQILDDLPQEVEQEYKFHPKRRFKIDYFIHLDREKGIGLGIEYEGGVYTRGRHTRPTGYINDCTKYNLALEYKTPVLRYTNEHMKDPESVEAQIKRVINQLRGLE